MVSCYFSVVGSAVLLHVGLFAPHFFWLVFIWPVPLFYCALQGKMKRPLLYGFLWGAIFFALHLIPVTSLCVREGQGISRFIFPVLLIAYCAIHPAIWFLLAHITAIVFKKSFFVLAVSWFFWTAVYLLWVPRGLLWLSGKMIGYPLSFPLLALVQHPPTLFLLHLVGREVLLACMLSCSLFFALFFYTRNFFYIALIGISFAPFVVGFFWRPIDTPPPDYVKNMGYVGPLSEKEAICPLDAAQAMCYKMQAILEKHPQITALVAPELCYRFALNNLPHVVRLWNDNALDDEVDLFIGAAREQGGKTFNSLYWISGGKIRQWYDKRLLMPLAEYLPDWCKKVPILASVFLDEAHAFSSGGATQKPFIAEKKVVLQQAICAEFFFDKGFKCHEMSDNSVLLLISMDAFFPPPHNPMSLWSQYKALELNFPGLYVGSSFAAWFSSKGKIFSLLK